MMKKFLKLFYTLILKKMSTIDFSLKQCLCRTINHYSVQSKCKIQSLHIMSSYSPEYYTILGKVIILVSVPKIF